MGSVTRRYAPLKRDNIQGFPNQMPKVNWQRYFPMFKDKDGDDATLHLITFHMHVHKLNIRFHEDCLMKMFMATLEGKAHGLGMKAFLLLIFILSRIFTQYFLRSIEKPILLWF
jgi:hypothetical protein